MLKKIDPRAIINGEYVDPVLASLSEGEWAMLEDGDFIALERELTHDEDGNPYYEPGGSGIWVPTDMAQSLGLKKSRTLKSLIMAKAMARYRKWKAEEPARIKAERQARLPGIIEAIRQGKETGEHDDEGNLIIHENADFEGLAKAFLKAAMSDK